MATLPPDVTAALAGLEARWGAAAPRTWTAAGSRGSAAVTSSGSPASGEVGAVVGSLATLPDEAPVDHRDRAGGSPAAIVSTGFADLDAILGPGGVPRHASVALRGDGSSGKTTLALRLAAEAQATGAIVAWVDVGRSFDPVEAVARGVRLPWLVVVTPEDLDEGLSIAGALLGGRAVDLLVVDLPPRPSRRTQASAVADRLLRLAALARRGETLLVLLEPPGSGHPLAGAVGESAGLRLELARRAWIRLGRDVVGQRTEVVVARNRFGPPGRRAGLRILYAGGDERDACLAREPLLAETPPVQTAPIPVPGKVRRATPPSAVAPPPARPGTSPPVLRVVPDGPDRRRGTAVDRRDRPRREPRGASAGDPPGIAARNGPPARA